MKQTILWMAVVLMAACATQKETHQHQTHTIEADSLSQQAEHDSHHQTTSANIDSIVTASIWAAMQEFARQEHEKETTTETITTWVDSLGREIRQEQRTTQREISKQEQQRTQQLLQQWQSEMQRQLTTMDSAWHSRLSVMERHLSDSLTATLDKKSQTSAAPALTWWQKTRAWICGALIGIVIGVVVMLTKKYWTKWIKI